MTVAPHRITYIHQHFRLRDEAGGTRSWEFARRLAEDGHVVTVIAAGEERATFSTDGFTVVRLPVPYRNDMSATERIRSFLSFMAASSVVAARTPTDVVLATSTPLTVAVPGMLAALWQRAPFVLEVRDLWPSVPIALGLLQSKPLQWAAQLLERVAYWRADRIIALSPSMADGVRAVRPSADVTVVPNACDFDSFGSTVLDRETARASLGFGDELVAVYAGSLGWSYNVEWVVRLAAEVPQVRFLILGEGASSEHCRTLASELGMDPDKLLPGTVPKRDVPRYYAAADVVVSSLSDHPSLQGNSLNKVFDAMATGRPVVFNHGGWLSDLLVETGAGWRLDRDTGSAATQLSEIVADRTSINRAGSLNEKQGQVKFSRDNLYEIFQLAVLSRHPKVTPRQRLTFPLGSTPKVDNYHRESNR